MKVILAVISVLFAFVALQVSAATRFGSEINRFSNNYDESRRSVSQELFEVDNQFNNNNYNNYHNYHNYHNTNNDDKNHYNDYENNFKNLDELVFQEEFNYNNNKNVHNANLYYNMNVYDSSATLGNAVTEKIAALERIVSKYSEMSDLQEPLYIKNVAVKSTKHNSVNFYNTQLKNLNDGDLMYMFIKPEFDTVFVEYQFDQLRAKGAFKSDLPQSNYGAFTVDLNKVRSNVTAGFTVGQYRFKPATFEYAESTVVNEQNRETTAFDSAIKKNLVWELQNAVSAEVYNSTHKGIISQLKAEITTPLYSLNNGQQAKLYDMKWTEDDFTIELKSIGTRYMDQANQKIELMSFTRKNINTYKTRYTIHLDQLQWNGDLIVNANGQRTIAQSIDFSIKNVKIQVIVTKNEHQRCGTYYTKVEIPSVQYRLNENWATTLQSQVEQKLPHFIQHSLEAYMQKSLEQRLCNEQY
ncbi:protein dopey homolog PFC0245c-like [Daktulosphaira vitifoliae]|uniref:protein dopey homolog PFC0245c-like n=1 Tax=Daktulosphaira vitifoliae TaxID=58002 RepID=UPI0021A97DAC|nr:protein dopey homolog PFC0245c-like [Daktulosphaira vitifoliae]